MSKALPHDEPLDRARCGPEGPSSADSALFTESWLAFRRARLSRLGSPYGPLSAVDLHWLDDQWRGFDGLPGAWRTVAPKGIALRVGRDEGVTVDSVPLDGELVVPDPAVDFPVIAHGMTLLSPLIFPEQVDQPARYGIQTRDPRVAADRLGMGIPAYAPDPRWVRPARFEAYAEQRPVTLNSIVNNMVKNLAVFGRVVFDYRGAEYALEVYGGSPDELHIPFRDKTSGITTFAGARVVAAPWPIDGAFELDFNRACNGPCGLSKCTTCALPPPGNTLPFAVEAGEKIPLWMQQPGDWAR